MSGQDISGIAFSGCDSTCECMHQPKCVLGRNVANRATLGIFPDFFISSITYQSTGNPKDTFQEMTVPAVIKLVCIVHSFRGYSKLDWSG